MRKVIFVLGAAMLAVGLAPHNAAAETVHCPVANVGNNDYFATNAVDCVYDGVKDGQNNLGGGTDEFLAGQGVNEASYGTVSTNSDSLFGITGWTIICSTGNATNACAGSGLNLTNIDNASTTRTADYSVTNVAYANYAIGIKDGSEPFWAVFLLDSTKSGVLSMTGGGFSHFVLYGAGVNSTNQNLDPVPEPASLLLLSSGLAFAGNRLRKRRANQAAL